MIQFCRQRHADAERQAFAQRTRGGFQGRDETDIRVALIDRSQFPQRIELVLGCVTTFRQHAVQYRRGVAFGENKPVAIGPFGVLWIVVHHVEKQRDYNFRGRQRSARVTRLGMRNHLDDIAPHLLGDRLKFCNVAGFFHRLLTM